MKYSDILDTFKAMRFIYTADFLSDAEKVEILKELRNSLPPEQFCGAFKYTYGFVKGLINSKIEELSSVKKAEVKPSGDDRPSAPAKKGTRKTSAKVPSKSTKK